MKANGKNQPLFSINIPLYNCEQYILSALQSINDQSFSDWEVVVVDDGSTDSSLRICAEQTIIPKEKIRVIAGSHAGQYVARRKLIENSQGVYILSLDADDTFVDSSSLELIARALLRSNCDVALFNATRSLKMRGSVVDYRSLNVDSNGLIQIPNIMSVMSSSYALNNVCFKAYRRTLWKADRNEREVNNTEDRLQCAQIMSKAKSCILIDMPLYYYRPNPNSVTNSSIPFKYLKDLIYVEESISNIIKSYDYDIEKRSVFLCEIVMSLISIMRKTCSDRVSRIKLYKKAERELLGSSLFSQVSPPMVPSESSMSVFAYKLLVSNKICLLDFLTTIKERINALFR